MVQLTGKVWGFIAFTYDLDGNVRVASRWPKHALFSDEFIRQANPQYVTLRWPLYDNPTSREITDVLHTYPLLHIEVTNGHAAYSLERDFAMLAWHGTLVEGSLEL